MVAPVRFSIAILGLVLAAATAIAAPKSEIYLSDTLSHTIVKDRFVVPFSLVCDKWTIEAAGTLKARQNNLWYTVAKRTPQTRTLRFNGALIKFRKYIVNTDNEAIRLVHSGPGNFIERVFIEIVKPVPTGAPVYWTLESHSEDDPLDSEAGFLTDPKEIALVKHWVDRGCPKDRKVWKLIGFSKGEAVSAYFGCAVVKHSLEDLKKMGKYPDLYTSIDGLTSEHDLDVDVLCDGLAMELE